MRSQKELEKFSVFLSLILRHNPEAIGLTVNNGGWVVVSDLIAKCAEHKNPITLEELQKIVETDTKMRYSWSATQDLLRANQGHSLSHVKVELTPKKPINPLYHGTSSDFMESINKKGLLPGDRNHVHLSGDLSTAKDVGERHIRKKGELVILEIDAVRMFADGYQFFLSDNAVWLTDSVPPQYFKIRG